MWCAEMPSSAASLPPMLLCGLVTASSASPPRLYTAPSSCWLALLWRWFWSCGMRGDEHGGCDAASGAATGGGAEERKEEQRTDVGRRVTRHTAQHGAMAARTETCGLFVYGWLGLHFCDCAAGPCVMCHCVCKQRRSG